MEAIRERRPLMRRNSHPLCQDVREATCASPTMDTESSPRSKTSSPSIPYDHNHSPPTPTFVDTRRSHFEHGFHQNGDALLANLHHDMLEEASVENSRTRSIVKARIAEIESRQAQSSIFSRSSNSAFTDWMSSSRSSYDTSTQSSDLESLTQMSDTQIPGLRRSMFPLEPIVVDKARNATKDAIEEAVPALYDLNLQLEKSVPNFTQHFRENLHNRLKDWRERAVQDAQEEVLNNLEFEGLGMSLIEVAKWKEEPERFKEKLIKMRNPENALVMHAELPKEVKKALQYGAKEMTKLKDEEFKKRKLITEKTARLMALVQRSEALVVAAEKVADVGRNQEMSLPAVYENILDPVVIQSTTMRDLVCGNGLM